MPYNKNLDADFKYFEYKCKYCGETHIFNSHINNMFLSTLYEFKTSTSNIEHANKCPNFNKITN